MLPAASFARTEKVCDPVARPVYAFGLVQAAYAAVSSLHSKVDPVSGERNWNVALVFVVDDCGPELITVSGGVWSIVHVWTAGVGSTLPAASFARTRKVCEPTARPE